MKRTIIILLAPIVFLMFSCYGPYYENDNGKTVNLPVGSPFEINLNEELNDEYSWRLHSYDSSIVVPVLSPKINRSGEDTSLKTFYFQVVGDGETTISLVYSTGERMDNFKKEFNLMVRSSS